MVEENVLSRVASCLEEKLTQTLHSKVSARLLRVDYPRSKSIQMIFIPALSFSEIKRNLAIPDVEKKADYAVLGPRQRDALGESGEIA